ncbi:MAG: flagellar motor protein MotB [Polyangiaceae bacterium]|nr:flagellar motor protein MotB [Polyangiaceae bacterium]
MHYSASRIASFKALTFVVLTFTLTHCGYSKEEWDQKLREGEALRSDLNAQRQAHDKCESEYASSLHVVDDLKRRLKERGLSLQNLNASLEQQKRALDEYRHRGEQLEQIRKRFEVLRERLKKLSDVGATVVVRDNRMLIQLPGDILFDSGKDVLKKRGQEVLLQVADIIRNGPELSSRRFQVAGHTDSQPLTGGNFRDNWGLSAMRARSVLLFLTKPVERGGGGLDATHWSAAGYADTDSVVSNDTEEGRRKNRRVEIVVQPDAGEMLDLNGLVQ